MKKLLPLSIFLIASIVFTACKSKHEEGVTSDYHAQWLNVSADTTTTTEAARSVLADEKLKDVRASSTSVDGKVSAKKADGTPINVTIKKKTDTTSEVSVVVGTTGQPALGAELARKIKDRVEGTSKTK